MQLLLSPPNRILFLSSRSLSKSHNKATIFPLSFHYLVSKSMASLTESKNPTSQNAPLTTQNYPVPLSPPLPAISKDMELARAMSASSRSSLFTLSRSDVLYEDQWLIAVNKPRGIYCEAVLESVPCILAETAEVNQGTKGSLQELHLANRLDRDTSGVMLITKSHKVASKLVKAFTDHKVRKTYIAFCVGSAPNWKNITLVSGHGRSKFGAWRVYAASDVGRLLPGGSSVRNMETSFEILSVNGQGNFKDVSEFNNDENIIVVEEKAVTDANTKKDEILVRAFPRSGRTHQIRLHCQYLGIPIRGDVKYEGVCEWKGRSFDSHELHAESLSLEHPVTGLPIMFRAPLPSWTTQVPCEVFVSGICNGRILTAGMIAIVRSVIRLRMNLPRKLWKFFPIMRSVLLIA